MRKQNLQTSSKDMELYFLTGNPNKFEEAKAVLPEIIQMDIDLPEIQSLDPKEVIKAKLLEARKHVQGRFFVEDQSLCMSCLSGLPGTYIKWFLKTIGIQGMADIALKLGNNKATVSTIFGYAKTPEDIYFFENSISGQIVPARGSGGFSWDPIFLPDGSELTYGEWKEKNTGPNGMRLGALEKFKEFLDNEKN